MVRVTWSDQALKDVEEISRFIEKVYEEESEINLLSLLFTTNQD